MVSFSWTKGVKVDSSVPLTYHDPKDFGFICVVKELKIRSRILTDLRIQSWSFFKKRTQIVNFVLNLSPVSESHD